MGYSSPKNTEKWGDWAKKGGVDRPPRPPYSDGPALYKELLNNRPTLVFGIFIQLIKLILLRGLASVRIWAHYESPNRNSH